MAAPIEQFLIDYVKSCLESEKHRLFEGMSNPHILEEISNTLRELQRVKETVIKANYGTDYERGKRERILAWLNFKEYYGMNIIQQSISRRLSTRVSKVHPLIFLWPGNCSMFNFESTDERFFLDFTAYFQI